jgi:hypothetical protein
MALPQLWVHDHSERGRDERITDEWRYVCELQTGMPGSRQGRWNCPEQRGQKMTARARDLAACSIKKTGVEQLDRSESEPSETSSHPCLLPTTLSWSTLHTISPSNFPPISHLRTDASSIRVCYARRRLPVPLRYCCYAPACTLSSWTVRGIYPLAQYLLRPENTTSVIFGDNQRMF